ncbi:MAG TPA: hypothetical protein GX699_10825 [Firmicutes bacterium]|nr:hypothetical protein [Bacillota bacterium]
MHARRNTAGHSKNSRREKDNLFLLNVMFLFAVLALFVLVPVCGLKFSALSVITSFIGSCLFISLT